MLALCVCSFLFLCVPSGSDEWQTAASGQRPSVSVLAVKIGFWGTDLELVSLHAAECGSQKVSQADGIGKEW